MQPGRHEHPDLQRREDTKPNTVLGAPSACGTRHLGRMTRRRRPEGRRHPDLISGTAAYHFFNSTDCLSGSVGSGKLRRARGHRHPTCAVPNCQSTGALRPGRTRTGPSRGDVELQPTDRTSCEPLIVDKGNLTLTTYIHDSLHNVVTSVPVNGTVHDTAHFGGAVSGFTPTAGNVSFTFYNTIDCTALASRRPTPGPMRRRPLIRGQWTWGRSGPVRTRSTRASPGTPTTTRSWWPTWRANRCTCGRSATRWASGAT